MDVSEQVPGWENICVPLGWPGVPTVEKVLSMLGEDGPPGAFPIPSHPCSEASRTK